MAPKDRGARPWDAAAAAVVLIGFFAYLLTAATVESYGRDTSTYYGLAKSILEQRQYWFDFEPHTQYPPGFPLLLAGAMALGAHSFSALVKVCIGVYFIGVAAVYLLVRRDRGASTALVVVTLLVTSYVFYFWSTVGMHSEAPYFTAGILTLLCADVAAGSGGSRTRLLAHTGVALLAAYLLLVRTIGITIVAGLFLWAVLPIGARASRQPRSPAWLLRWGATLTVPLVAFALWMSWSSANAPLNHPDDYMQSYVQQVMKEDPHQIDSGTLSLASLPSRMVRMTKVRIESATWTLLNLRSIPLGWRNPLCILLALLIAAGWIVSLARRSTPGHWYLLTYFGMLIVYPFDEGSRYLHPVQPLLLLYAIEGLTALKKRAGEWLGASRALQLRTAGVLLATVVVAGVYQISAQARVNMAADASRFLNAATVAAAEWIKANTSENAVVMADEHAVLYRLTGRKSLRFPLTTNTRVLRERVVDSGVQYIVVLNERAFEYYNPSTERRFAALAAESPDAFVPAYVFAEGTIYRVRSLSAKS